MKKISLLIILFIYSFNIYSQDFTSQIIGKWILDTCFMIDNEILIRSVESDISVKKQDEILRMQTQINTLKNQLKVETDSEKIESINKKIEKIENDFLIISSSGIYEFLGIMLTQCNSLNNKYSLEFKINDESIAYTSYKLNEKDDVGIAKITKYNNVLTITDNYGLDSNFWIVFCTDNELFLILDGCSFLIMSFIKTY